jgi:2-polyprenyl-3-methyl-5-hydroxy-6-metoxy-1,4-benzoquinol methylase
MSSLGYEAYACDLDEDDLDRFVTPGFADFIMFVEAFEHVRRPLHVLRKLVRMLRPGGRLYFTSQYYAPNVKLQIRVEEPVFINAHTRELMVAELRCKVVDLVEDFLKMRVTLQKL